MSGFDSISSMACIAREMRSRGREASAAITAPSLSLLPELYNLQSTPCFKSAAGHVPATTLTTTPEIV